MFYVHLGCQHLYVVDVAIDLKLKEYQ